MRSGAAWLLGVSLAVVSAACGETEDSSRSDAGAAGKSEGGRAGTSNTSGTGGASGRGTSGSAGSGATSGSATNAGSAGTGGERAGNGGTASGRGGSGGTAASAGGAGARAGGGGASSGNGGSSNGGSSGTGEEAGAGAEAGAAGAPNDGSCESPFETLDITHLTTTETLEPYTVTGSTANQIRQSIDANRGRDYDAYTSWYLSWSYADCSGGGLVVTADVVYSVPEWDEPSGAPAELVESWQTYMAALFCHEYGHARLGLQAANDTYSELSSIDAGGDCDAQQDLAQEAFDAILDDYGERELAYDDDTDHGATMG